MRIDPAEAQMIRRVVEAQFGTETRLWLFGSRTDDTARGGDVDILVDVGQAVENPAWAASCAESTLMRALGGRRVDVVLAAPNLQETALHRLARRDGVPL